MPFIKRSLSSLRHPLVRLYLRFLPLLFAFTIISAFTLTRPQEATSLYNQILSRLHLQAPSEPSSSLNPDPISPVNAFRNQKNLPPLDHSPTLDRVAEIIALSLSTQAQSDTPISLEQAAQIADYPYQSIAYAAAINPLPLIQDPAISWQGTDSENDFANSKFTQIGYKNLQASIDSQTQLVTVIVLSKPAATKTTNTTKVNTITTKDTPSFYTGVELWQELQKYRREHGVPEFKQDNSLCTLASIRVNQLLELGKLDNHDGFQPLVEKYQRDGYITHKNLGENILSGYTTPANAIAGWDGSLGHQALMKDGSYVWACTAANYGFAVLIAAY